MSKSETSKPRRRRVASKSAPKATKKTNRRSRKAEVVADSSRAYPFPTKAQLAERIANESGYAVQCVQLLHALEAPMCSHRAAFTKLVGQIEASKDATKSRTIVAEARRLASRYTRRLALEERKSILSENPELSSLAELFSAAA